ncbi:MAG TPA: hypothetical protein VH370_11270 [Humisphaera sp.]|jgi:hypothetical protein|nr:hypothetical protein [Humisphaera sp.]
MTRLRYILLNGLIAIAAVLFVAITTLWIRSFFVSDGFGWTTPRADWSLTIGRGRLNLAWRESRQALSPSHYHSIMRPAQTIRTYGDIGRLGVYLDRRATFSGARRWSLVFPIWPALLLSGLLAFCGLFSPATRQWRKLKQRCIVCGYDLRQTPEKCPECGATPARKSAA